MNYNIMTIDVEDWFQVENLKDVINQKDWEQLESRVEKNVNRILELLKRYDASATFFILGWIAERYPDMIKKIYNQGHEIASHGYSHELIYNMSPEKFQEDLIKSKKLIENIIGEKISGYRAPSFSITDWAIQIIRDVGFTYDSSYVDTTLHDRYGALTSLDNKKSTFDNGLKEIKMMSIKIMSFNIPWGGGGYFRIMPFSLYKLGYNNLRKKRDYNIFYLHPWEIDSNQPRLKGLKLKYKFRHYYGLKNAEKKFIKLLKTYNFISIEDYLLN